MRRCTRFVRIDDHDRDLHPCVMDEAGRRLSERRVANDAASIVEAVGEGFAIHATIEASTGAADLAEALGE